MNPYAPTESQPFVIRPHRGTSPAPLSREDRPPAPAAGVRYCSSMHLLERDRVILTLVSRFGQLTSAHIDSLLFGELQSRKPCQRVLKRMYELELLHRVNQRLPGGPAGGSQRIAYALGPAAWRMFYPTKYRKQRVLNLHSLAIADVYVAAKLAERDGKLKVVAYATEPDSWRDVAGADLRPDLYLDLDIVERPEAGLLWVEVDLATERQRQIVDKLERYARAYRYINTNHAELSDADMEFPAVLFLAPDHERVGELTSILQRFTRANKDIPDGLFSVALLADFPALLLA